MIWGSPNLGTPQTEHQLWLSEGEINGTIRFHNWYTNTRSRELPKLTPNGDATNITLPALCGSSQLTYANTSMVHAFHTPQEQGEYGYDMDMTVMNLVMHHPVLGCCPSILCPGNCLFHLLNHQPATVKSTDAFVSHRFPLSDPGRSHHWLHPHHLCIFHVNVVFTDSFPFSPQRGCFIYPPVLVANRTPNSSPFYGWRLMILV